MRLARSLAFDKAGNNKAARIAIMAITTSNSIKVNPACEDFVLEANNVKRDVVFIDFAKSLFQK
jgi:hypothetical protein